MKAFDPTLCSADAGSLTAVRVLVIEDEVKVRRSLADAFRLETWAVAEEGDGHLADSLVTQGGFDLIVLDWMLPGRSGIEIVRSARARGVKTPVLMLTARDGVGDRVIGLDSGADDFLPKPFAVAELIARCRALLRRSLINTADFLSCDDLHLDTRSRIARRGEDEIQLTSKEVDVLEYLMRYQGQIVTREMLERDVWKQTHRFTSLDNVIDVQMMRLRRKVDLNGKPKLIHTLRGVGYRLGEIHE